MPILSWEAWPLQLITPFRVSYGSSDTRQAFLVRLAQEQGWGEGTIPFYYGIPFERMTVYWDAQAQREDALPESLDDLAAWIDPDGPAPARCAVELALLDRLATRAALPLWRYLALPQPRPLPTSYTLSIDTPQAMAQAARSAPAQALKVKLGGDGDDLQRLRAIRAACPQAGIRIDANAGWTFEQAQGYLSAFEPIGLELIEQPLAREAFDDMGRLQALTPIPIVADESVQSVADVRRLIDAGVRGINLKLMKLGGILTALTCLKLAQEARMQVMLGCMIETSLGVTAMAHLMGSADWVDLDPPMLVSNDPFAGITYDAQQRVIVPDRPGIGALRKTN